MRLWMLSCELAHEVAGGIARYVDNFSRLLGAAGHEVVVLARSNQHCDFSPAPGVRIIGFRPRDEYLGHANSDPRPDSHQCYPYNVVSYAQALSHEIADRTLALLRELPRPDVIECHEYMALPYYLLQRKLNDDTPLSEIPILVHMHGPLHELLRINQEPRYLFPDWWTGQMEKASVAMADAVLSPSHFLANRIRQVLGPRYEGEIERIPYPVDDRGSGGDDIPVRGEVVYVGRLQLLKGVLPMLAACSRMWAAGRNFRLTMVGGDTRFTPRNISLRQYIENKYARWIEAGRLRLPGPMPYDQVLSLMRGAWCSLVPSLWENFPNVCIEAMMSGTIVLGSTSGGQAEMIGEDGRYGFLFDWNAPGSFERQLDRVLQLPDAERATLAARARERIHQLCATKSVLDRRLAHFEQIIRNYQPPRRYPALQALQGHRLPAEPTPLPTTWLPPAPMQPPRDSRPGVLSVVIPFYNLGQYIGDTLASIRASTYSDVEVILVNDGSTDEASRRVVEHLEAERQPGLRVVHTENCGLAQTRNNGADHASGEYLCFLDADDCVEPDYFARAIRILKRYDNVDFVCSWIRYFGEQNDIWPVFPAELPYLMGHNMCTAFAVIRRETFERCGRNKPVMEFALEDHEMWVSMLAGGAVGAALCDPLVRYRVRKGSMLQSSTVPQQLYLFDVLSQIHPQLYREWGIELFNLQNANGPGRAWNHPAQQYGQVDRSEVDHLRAWLADVERGRDWLAGQRQILIETVDRLEKMVAEQQAWTSELQAGKDWLEGQWRQATEQNANLQAALDRSHEWREECEQLREQVRAWKQQIAYRAMRKLLVVKKLGDD